MSKGSAPRKGRDDKAFAAGWERIFVKDSNGDVTAFGFTPGKNYTAKVDAKGNVSLHEIHAQNSENALQALTEVNEGLGLYDEEFTVPALGPCKFCGSTDLHGPTYVEADQDTQMETHWFIECKKCHAHMSVEGENVDALLDAWNGNAGVDHE